MAQLNITLNQEEILQLLQKNQEGAFRELLKKACDAILIAESTEQLQAKPYERTEERTDSRNGSRERQLTTRIGTITLEVPRHRNVPFKTLLFENYKRSEAALITTMAEMVVLGVSTRKVGDVMETLCGKTFSKSAVSEACKELDGPVEEFRNRKLAGEYPFVIVDATYFKVRENHRIVSKALLIAIGTTAEGRREVLGLGAYGGETEEAWKHFLQSLKNRGLHGVKMITSDAHKDIIAAISRTFPTVPWQRCQYHFTRNIVEKAPKKYREGLRTELQDMFNQSNIEAARERRDEIITDYRDIAESAMECLDRGFEEAMTVMVLPEGLRKPYRTSNAIERLNRELKRRSKAVGVFPNEESLIRLMGSVLIEEHNRMSTKYRMFYQPTYLKLLEVSDQLEEIAREQRNLLAA